jgi:hypothetical protein
MLFNTYFFDDIMQKRKIVFAFSISFVVFMFLNFLRLFNLIGNEFELLIRWVSTISLLLTGILVGILILDKKINVKTALINLVLVIIGLALIPILTGIIATIVNPFPFAIETKLVVTFILPASIGLIYLWFFIRYQKKKASTLW